MYTNNFFNKGNKNGNPLLIKNNKTKIETLKIFPRYFLIVFIMLLLTFTSTAYSKEKDSSNTKNLKLETFKVYSSNPKTLNDNSTITDNSTLKRNKIWLLFNYNHPISGKDFNAENGYGSINVNVGYNIWRIFSIEFYLGGRMSNDSRSSNIELIGESQTNGNIYKVNGVEKTNVDYSLFDFGATLLFQPKFDKDVVIIMPYIGLGPLFSYSKVDYSNDISYDSSINNVQFNYPDSSRSETSIDVGMKIKGGVRFNMITNLMFGLNLEYIYLKGKSFSEDLDLSTFSIGVEFGAIF